MPQASRGALVLGLHMTSRILRSDVSDAKCKYDWGWFLVFSGGG